MLHFARTHFSIGMALSKPKQLAEKCKEAGYDAVCMCDLGTVSGALYFQDAMKKVGIKPILGCSFYLSNRLSFDKTLTVIAKNLKGWYELVSLVSHTNDNFYRNEETDRIYPLLDPNEVPDSDNLFVLDDVKPSHYINGEDYNDQLVMFAVGHKTTIKTLREINELELFMSHRLNVDRVIQYEFSSYEIEQQCEEYDIRRAPQVPRFEVPKIHTQITYLRELCREGWRKKLPHLSHQDQLTYGNRVKQELEVIEKADLAGYFLIVQDYVKWAKQTMLVGPGRGSAAGSLVSYLIDITSVDPIKYDLLFERFYNEGRNTGDYIALPDIDVDFPPKQRYRVFDYLKEKYTSKRVAKVVTFSRLMGSGALKAVLRAHDVCSSKEMDKITKQLPDESKISDQLQETGETSILSWVLKYQPKIVKDWCRLEDGEIVGDYGEYFAQAIRLEGTYSNTSSHASAVIIGAYDLDKMCPMMYNKTEDSKTVGMEYTDADQIGLMKFDVLGVNALEKLMDIRESIRRRSDAGVL